MTDLEAPEEQAVTDAELTARLDRMEQTLLEILRELEEFDKELRAGLLKLGVAHAPGEPNRGL